MRLQSRMHEPNDTQARVLLRKPQQITNHALADCQKAALESFLGKP